MADESKIWTAWEMIDPKAGTKEIDGKPYTYFVAETRSYTPCSWRHPERISVPCAAPEK
jgi:hypothetical protein